MKSFVYLIILAVLLTSCSYTGKYSIILQEVSTHKNILEKDRGIKIVDFQNPKQVGYSYEDSLIQITWMPEDTLFSFRLNNKLDNSIKIIWDDAVFVDYTNTSMKVLHFGVAYNEIGTHQIPTIIISGTSYWDIIHPFYSVRYITSQPIYKWWLDPILPNEAIDSKNLELLTSQIVGKDFKILLPVEIEGKIIEYLFTFKIDSFTKSPIM